MRTALPHLVDILHSASVIVPDDGGGAADLGDFDRAGRVLVTGAADDDGAIARDRRAVHTVDIEVQFETSAGIGEASARAAAAAIDISTRLLSSHDFPVGDLDRGQPHAPVLIEVDLVLVTMLERGQASAEQYVAEQARSIAHRLNTTAVDGLAGVAVRSADVDLFDDDQLRVDLRVDLRLDPNAGDWPGVRAWLTEQLRALSWTVYDDGWGAGLPPAETYGHDVAAVHLKGVAGAELSQLDPDGLLLVLTVPITSIDKETS